MRKISLFTCALTAGALIFVAVTFVPAVHAAEDLLKVRKEGFEASKKSFGAIKKLLEEGGDLSAAAAPAQSINAFAKQVLRGAIIVAAVAVYAIGSRRLVA